MDGHQKEIYSVNFSLDGRLVVSGSGDETVRIWDLSDGGSRVLKIRDSDRLDEDHGVTSVAISPDGRLVAAGSLDTLVRIWDMATSQLLRQLHGHRDSVYSVAFMPDGKGLVSASLDKTLKYWDISMLMLDDGEEVKECRCIMDFIGHKVRVHPHSGRCTFPLCVGRMLIRKG